MSERTLSNVSETTDVDNGRVGVVRGSIGFPNQPANVGLAALRTGSDHVRTLVTEHIYEIVAAGERLENETGTSALTVAGTGDTLAGITASLLGQGLDRQEAAVAA